MPGAQSRHELLHGTDGIKEDDQKQLEKKQYINISAHSQTKQAICDLLCMAIRATAAGDDLVELRYDQKKEVVHADFLNAYDARQINVACDSGWAMIKDIVNNIDIG